MSPGIGNGLTSATIAKGEEKNAVRLASPRGNQEDEMHQALVVPALLTGAQLKLLQRFLKRSPWEVERSS